MHWAREAYNDASSFIRQSLVDYGLVDPPPKPVEEVAVVEEQGSNWLRSAFSSLASPLKGPSASSSNNNNSSNGRPLPGTFKTGEVVGDYVKNASGEYQLLSLTVDVPSSKAPYPGRAVIYWSPDADREGIVGRRR